MKKSSIYIYGILAIALSALISCSRNAYKSTNKMYKKQAKELTAMLRKIPDQHLDSTPMVAQWAGTINFNLRKPNFVIIHHTAQNSCDQTLRTFTVSESQVSAHYVICKDGTVRQMLNDYFRAWHAGVSKWGNVTDINSISIGIELDNNGTEAFPERQINSLLVLLNKLKKDYKIPTANFIGHADIAPVRKNDPSVYFPWKAFSEKGFGLWYRDTTGVVTPANFNNLQALRIIGYDVADSSAAIRAFRRHFLQTESGKPLNRSEQKVLYCVMEAYSK